LGCYGGDVNDLSLLPMDHLLYYRFEAHKNGRDIPAERLYSPFTESNSGKE